MPTAQLVLAGVDQRLKTTCNSLVNHRAALNYSEELGPVSAPS